MRGEQGSITIWMVGLTLLILALGGLAIDYWRALALQRELAAVADSAVLAGASGIDEAHYRATGEVILDRDRAASLAARAVAAQDVALVGFVVDFAPGGVSVTVVVEAEVELGLLRLLTGEDDQLTVSARATAYPLRVP